LFVIYWCVLAVWQKIKSGKEVERWRPEVEVLKLVRSTFENTHKVVLGTVKLVHHPTARCCRLPYLISEPLHFYFERFAMIDVTVFSLCC